MAAPPRGWVGRLRQRGELVALAGLLTAQAAVFAQIVPLAAAANYDEGTYLASADALHHGQELGRDVFTSQPPGWYYLLAGIQSVVGRSVEAHRAALMVFALAGTLATYGLIRQLAGAASALVAAAAVGVAPAYARFSAQIVADVPALALALASLALATFAFAPRRSAAWAAAGSGLLLTLAVSVKLTAATAVVPLLGLAIVLRPRRDVVLALVAAALAAACALLVANLGALSQIWDGAVTYHRRAAALPDVPPSGTNVYNLRRFFVDPGTALFWIGCAGLVAFAFAMSLRARAVLLPFWIWTGVTAVALVETRPLHENHYTLLSVAVALPAGASLGVALGRLPGGARSAAVAAVVALFGWGYVAEGLSLAEEPRKDGPDIAWSVRRVVAETSGGELVAADRPIVAFLADRRLPGALVDTAHLRFATGSLTSASVLSELDRRQVRAVVAGREFRRHPELVNGLQRRFRVERRHEASFYLRR